MISTTETSRKVLIVDGDASTRREVRTACAQDGYQVLEADSGADGLRELGAARPSLVLLEVELTHTEFDLLNFLASNAGKVLSREKILNSIWGYEYPIETRVIDVHIRNLRRKIETQPSRPYYILAVPGIGYRFTNARPN